MSHIVMRIVVVLAALLAAGAVRAQINEARAEELLRLSGVWSQLASLAPQMKESLEQAMARPESQADPEVQQKIGAAALKAFEVERMRASARRTAAEGLRASHLPELLAWYQSEDGRRVTQAEETDSAKGGDSDARAKAGLALLQAATPERRQLLVRLVETTRAGSATADLVANLAIAVQLSMARLNPKAPRVDEATLRASIEAERPEMSRAFDGLSLATYAVVYKDLPDSSVAAYVRFAGSAAGDHYNDISNRAFEAAMLQAFGALGR